MKTLILPKMIYGYNSINELRCIVEKYDTVLYLIDSFFKNDMLKEKIYIRKKDVTIFIDVTNEPRTSYVDSIIQSLKKNIISPDLIIAIGGGSTLDIGKAVSIILMNGGLCKDYQGWDLVKKKGIYKIGIPTISGTGAEVSRTAVMISEIQKLGINSDYSVFDLIILDPSFLQTVPNEQYFYTAMDCFIHCVESIKGTFINEFSRSYSEKAIELCREVFLNKKISERDAKIMMASYFGGCAIYYSETGICHALSYGLSFILNIHHGIGNCIVFNVLDDFYGDYVNEFRKMAEFNSIKIPKGIMNNVGDNLLDKMVELTLKMEKPLTNAFGGEWSKIMTKQKIKELYKTM
ncbi:iron-containing alcohol dehydrogenase [Candidatus Gracilibacteria bacterium]|nr:iron-containing alcohol dehydrogenase [Candidatus Gracilibacteria bacterium]